MFVTLILVPVVTCTGTMVDVARLKLYSSQAAMAADSYGYGVLGNYDNLLKELYGLFALSGDVAGMQAVEDLANYTEYSFVPNGDDKDLEGFMPYKDAEIVITHEAVTDSEDPKKSASLANNNVLMTQVGDFMKFRVIEELMDEAGILSCFEGLDKMSADMDAVETRNEITDSSSEALGKIDEYYQILKDINDYSKPKSGTDGYLEERQAAYKKYSDALAAVLDDEDYKKYAAYVGLDATGKKTVDDAHALIEEEEEAKAKIAELEAQGLSTEGVTVPEVTDEDRANAEKYVDVATYKPTLSAKFTDYTDTKLNATGKRIKFDEFGDLSSGRLADLNKKADELEATLTSLNQQISDLEAQLPSCSTGLQTGINDEINGRDVNGQHIVGLKEVADMAGDFPETVTLMVNNGNTAKDAANKQTWENGINALQAVEAEIIAGTKTTCDWETTITFQWYDFKTDKQEFYDQLKSLCDTGGSGEGDKDAGDKQIERANEALKTAQEEVDKDEGRKARNLTTDLANQMKATGTTAEIPDFGDMLSGGASLADLGNNAVNKFLLTTYDFGMFSSRVTGIEEPEDDVIPGAPEGGPDVDVPDVDMPEVPAGDSDATDVTDVEDGEDEYFDESLTGIKMSDAVNYMYGAEIEYLIAGYTGDNSAKDNQAFTRNVICGIRATTNFVSTYTIPQINSTINAIADSAATAVAATGVGAAAAPLVRVAVSGALRLAVAGMETAADWGRLIERKPVIFYKSKWDDLTSKDILTSFFTADELSTDGGSGVSTDSSVKLDFELSYEDYLWIMMIFFVDADTLLDRTSNLITLNVNQAENTSGEDLKTLDFKMNETVTAIKSTCEIDLDFVIVPENFINMFITDGDADAVIQKLNNGSYGYSVIRGY